MKEMKTSSAIILMILVSAMMFGCGGGSGQVSSGGASNVTIAITGLRTAALSASSAQNGVAIIDIIISAPDMETITRSVPVVGDTIAESFVVPNGSNRHFLAVAFASDNSVLSQGHTFSDLNGNAKNIEILMGVDVSGEWTFTCTAQGKVPETDFITFTQAGNFLNLVETTIGGSTFNGTGTVIGNSIQFTVVGFACGSPSNLTGTGTFYADGSLNGAFTATGGNSGTWSAVRGHISPPVQGTVSGTVTDAVAGGPLDGVSMILSQQGSTIAAGTTGSDGKYTLSASAGSGYSLVLSKSGYVTKTIDNISVAGNNTTTVDAALTATSPVSQGTVSGAVADALTSAPLAGVSITLSKQGSTITTGTTGTDGKYTLTAPAAGGYSVAFSKSGYITSTFDAITITANAATTLNAVLSPVLSAGQVRIILTWDYSKGNLDLDAHLKGPRAAGDTITGPFHTWFGNRTYISAGIKYADLDVDWITPADGPVTQETTTIYQQVSGVYTFYVHDFTNGGSANSSALSNSTAQVSVYIGNDLTATYSVPAGQPGTVWTVFQLSGGTLAPINTLSSNETVILSVSQKAYPGKTGKRLR